MGNTIPCWIYKSTRKEEMFLYLPREDDFTDLPTALMNQFGQPEFVMQLDLHTERMLAREDVNRVMQNLTQQGFHLQLPAELEPHLYFGE